MKCLEEMFDAVSTNKKRSHLWIEKIEKGWDHALPSIEREGERGEEGGGGGEGEGEGRGHSYLVVEGA